MTCLKLHFDGWVALPPAFRRALSLSTNDRLEAELVDGAIVLWPAARSLRKVKAAAGPEQAAIEGKAGDPAPAARRKPGRPGKAAPDAEQSAPALKPEPGYEPAPPAGEAVHPQAWATPDAGR